MKNLFEPAAAQELQTRLSQLKPDSPRLWGKMSPQQMLAHCSAGMEMALGDKVIPPSPLPLRLLGRIIKPIVMGNDKPIRRNAPTAKELVISSQPDLDTERERLAQMITRFVTSGAPACTRNPHPFFGKLSPDEWSILVYKHLDHHFRQFSV